VKEWLSVYWPYLLAALVLTIRSTQKNWSTGKFLIVGFIVGLLITFITETLL
jgi:hypothetical protein